MPSEKILAQKQQYVAELTEKMKKSVTGVLVDYKGINVEDDTKLRSELRKEGVDYSVVKNTMIHLALPELGLTELDEYLSGSTALALSEDNYVAAAKILTNFAEKSKTFKIKGGFVDGQAVDEEGVQNLAKLPSREVLIATVLGGLNAPITSFVYVLNANLSGLARVIQSIADQKASD